MDVTTKIWQEARHRKEQNWMKQRADLARLLSLGPEQAARELDRRCPHCGALIVPRTERFYLPWEGKERETFIWPSRCGCPEEAAALTEQDKQVQVDRERQARSDWERRLDRAGLVGWLAGASFDNFLRRKDWDGASECRQKVLTYANSLLDRQLNGRSWLILHGAYGTGKSHLAASIIRAALEAKWPQCYFRVWTEYLQRLQNSWDTRGDQEAERQADIERELQQGRVVVIDDLDKRRPTGWSREVLFGALNHRYNLALPTILTFNWGPDDKDPVAPGRLALEEYLGRAVLDRLIGSAWDVIEFRGPSFRSGVQVEVDRNAR